MVEIDESSTSTENTIVGNGDRVFGAIERHSGRCCMVAAPDRTRNTHFNRLRGVTPTKLNSFTNLAIAICLYSVISINISQNLLLCK